MTEWDWVSCGEWIENGAHFASPVRMQVGFLPEIFPQKRSKEISGFLTDISHNFRKSKPITSTQTEVPTGSPPRGGDVAVHVFDINQPSLPTPFYSVLESVSVFMALSTVFYSINSPNNCPLSHSVLPVLFLPYRSFQLYISLWKSPSALI